MLQLTKQLVTITVATAAPHSEWTRRTAECVHHSYIVQLTPWPWLVVVHTLLYVYACYIFYPLLFMFMLVSVTGLDFDENDSSRLSVSCCCAVFATALVYCSAADSDCWSRCTAVSFCVLYGSFYYWYMPSVVHERPVHFKFRLASRNNQCCYQGLGCQGQGLKISKAKAKVFKAKYLQKAKAKAMISERKTVYRPWRLAPSWARWGQINNSWATQSRTMPRQACQVLEAKAMAPVLKDPGGQGVVLEDTSLEITTTTNHLVCKNSRHYIA